MLIKSLSLVLLTFMGVSSIANASINDNVFNAHLSGEGDTFSLFEDSYDENEGFVYTADVKFNEGQAAGLVFGAIENTSLYVFNVDRFENKVKLLHFTKEDTWKANELYVAPFIGNDKTTQGEYSMINPKVRTLDKINLKVVVSYDSTNAYVECFADNIVRFDIDAPLRIENYTGGKLGLNVFNANVDLNNIEIGRSDYSYYTELYRNQYHFSQYAHWNNDPNGLVYYNGYYHMYFQTHPYSQYWSDMYWGHARSKDLLHWQLLPICLFPDTEGEFGPSNGYMWSGSAMVYRKGMSALIDSYNWFPDGDGEGLIAFYTRHCEFCQDQVLMSSDDEGLTWTKRVRIPQSICTNEGYQDCRDPEIFPIKKDGEKVTMWGMILSSVSKKTCWFLKSSDLVNWSYAGEFPMFYPECISIIDEDDKDGITRQIIMFSSRYYIVGNITYNESTGRIDFIDLNNRSLSSYTADTLPLETMDYAADSYACQSFYIDDPNSKYFGKDISLNWFSGVPNSDRSAESGMFAQARTNWNGSGMTIPVELGLNDSFELTQKPITIDNEDLNKTNVVDIENVEYSNHDENILKDVSTHIFEAIVEIDNENQAEVIIRINEGEGEYTDIGWNKEEGYFVDRTHTSSAGIAFNNFGFDNYHVRYASNAAKNDTKLDFYILSDNGALEVFAKGYTIPFYVLTLASPYSIGASLIVDEIIKINKFELNEIASVWRDDVSTDEGVLYISSDDVYLDTTVTKAKDISVYYTGECEIEYELTEGEDIINITPTKNGLNIQALKEGSALVSVNAKNKNKIIKVTVKTGSIDTDIEFNEQSVISGEWIMSGDGLTGRANGDGFILSSTYGSDFIYSARIDSSKAVAAALVFRADASLKNYLVANYDSNAQIVKLWSNQGVLKETHVSIDTSNYVITVEAQEKNVSVTINSFKAIEVTVDDQLPVSGLFGLNVYNGSATFNDIALSNNSTVYNGGDLIIESPSEQHILSIYNITNKNTLIDKEFYSVEDKIITIKEEYFVLLKQTGSYYFKFEGTLSSFIINVDVLTIPSVKFNDQNIQYGTNLVVFIGNTEINNLTVNGQELTNEQFRVKDYTLIVDADVFEAGENIVCINENIVINVNVVSLDDASSEEQNSYSNFINQHLYLLIIIPSLITVLIVSIFIIKKKRGNNYGG